MIEDIPSPQQYHVEWLPKIIARKESHLAPVVDDCIEKILNNLENGQLTTGLTDISNDVMELVYKRLAAAGWTVTTVQYSNSDYSTTNITLSYDHGQLEN